MLEKNKNKYFEIIRENIFDDNGFLVYEDYVQEFQPYDVPNNHKKYANFGAIQLLEFGVKSESPYSRERKDKKFRKKYERTKAHIEKEILLCTPTLEIHITDTLSQTLLTPLLRNLTYGESSLTVWIIEDQTYALVNAGLGDSACNLLFFCRVEEFNKKQMKKE